MGNAQACIHFACYVYESKGSKCPRNFSKLKVFLEKCKSSYNDIFSVVSDIQDANLIFVVMDSECTHDFELNKFLIQTQHMKTLFVYLSREYYDKEKKNHICTEDTLSVNLEKFNMFLNSR